LICAIDTHPQYRWIVAANRDEFHERASAPLQWWHDEPQVLGGRDLVAGGSWFAVSRDGRFAAITNFRQAKYRQTEARPEAPPQVLRSRGEMVTTWLTGREQPQERAAAIADSGSAYGGYNLLAADRNRSFYISNRAATPARELLPGIYGLSNHLLDTPWPKLVRAKQKIASEIAGSPSIDRVLEILADRDWAAPADLPDTGLDPAVEARLSAPFVLGSAYGTRASTVMLWGRDDRVRLHERRYNSNGEVTGDVDFEFQG
jgi:uncharacterized protein with NRDE domain